MAFDYWGSRVTYSYDPSGQLSSEIRSGSGAYAITYSYDALGNRLSQTEDGVLTSYSYGAANQLQSEQTGAASTTYLYDENGNVRSEQTGTLLTTYTWDEENRLTKVEYSDGSVDTYVYFQDGRRWRAQSTLGASTTTTLFIWDGLNLLLEEDAGLIARVQWTNFPDQAREVLVMRQAGTSGLSNGASFFPGFDLSGNTRLMVGAAGISKWRGLYESFGEERALIGYGGQVAQSTLSAGYGGQVSGLSIAQRYGGQVGSTFEVALNHLRFGGQVGYYTDREGRVYVRARHYDSSTGRWLSPDPIGFAGGDWNLYAYVANNPVNVVDPSGFWGQEVHGACTTAWAKEVYVRHPTRPGKFLVFALPEQLGGGSSSMDDPQRASLVPWAYPPHFNTWKTGDSRVNSFLIARRFALMSARKGVRRAGNCRTALYAFGQGLHSIQDIYSHQDILPREHADYRNTGFVDFPYARRSSIFPPETATFYAGEGAGYGVAEEGGKKISFRNQKVRVWKWVYDPHASRLKKTEYKTKQLLRRFLLDLYRRNPDCVAVVSRPPRRQPTCYPKRTPMPQIVQPILPSMRRVQESVNRKTAPLSGALKDFEEAIERVLRQGQ